MELEALIQQNAPDASARSAGMTPAFQSDMELWIGRPNERTATLFVDTLGSTTRIRLNADECDLLAAKLIAQAREIRSQQTSAAA